MKIYSMTATFGKLEHQTLELQSGLNIIEAPNEWGKSTWCAFLVTMLYGLDTRAKNTKTALADKERYAPWSGSPMSGRIDLNWNGRDITIERYTKGRTPMGEFRAYETESGIAVNELTATNCGQQLLGVERSVFTRAGFLRFSDLPVTNDEALRHRLNALVTTGDESGAAQALGQKLRELKNRCRYRNSGLLPQAEAQRRQLEEKLSEQKALTDHSGKLRKRQQELEQWSAELQNHKTALQYAAAQDDAQRVREASAALEAALARQAELEEACRPLPSEEAALHTQRQLHDLHQEWDALQMETQMLPPIPPAPVTPECFRGKSPAEAVAQAEADYAAMEGLTEPQGNLPLLLMIAGMIAAVTGIVLTVMQQGLIGIISLCIGIMLTIAGFIWKTNRNRQSAVIRSQRLELSRRYGSNDPNQWVKQAHAYQSDQNAYYRRVDACRNLRGDLDARLETTTQKIIKMTSGRGLTNSLHHWNGILAHWDALSDARRDVRQAEHHLQTLRSMVKPAQPPATADTLTYTMAETDRLLSDAGDQLRQLHNKLGQYQGQSDAIGSSHGLQRELEAVNSRIASLEQTYTALEYAENALTEAKMELQRRFAPRITKQAKALFSELTDGRYQQLTLAEDLSLHAAAEGENTLRSQQWRSDGTVDQLYLALRLAVAKELTADAPLILDDALVRFDDTRLATALKILRREAETKQVILFTCHSREKNV